jgi:hypothetical protein
MSCEKQSQFDEPSSKNSDTAINQFDYSANGQSELELFTLAVNEALKEKSFRIKLKEEAMKQFDGDYDVLLSFNNKSSYNEIEQLFLWHLKNKI